MPLHILVVEDNALLAANLADALEAGGHSADFAANGVLGLQRALNTLRAADLKIPHDGCRTALLDLSKQAVAPEVIKPMSSALRLARHHSALF